MPSRNYSKQTLKNLFAKSGNQCAFPDCKEKLINSDNALNSDICHIEALNSKGARYNADNREINSYSNLIPLCKQHHSKIDNNEYKYTVEILKEMKQKHEIEMDEKISPKQKISAIAKVVNKISEIEIEKIKGSEVKFSFKPEDKIEYNDIKRYKYIFEKYAIHSAQLNTIYNEMEAEGTLKKNMILENIQSIYLMVKGKLSINSQVHAIQADNIIEKVQDELLNKLENSNLDEENIGFAIEVIIIDAFMRCKILEEPPQ